MSIASGIPFKKVRVNKQINYHGKHFNSPTIAMANEYCKKVTGEYTNRSIWNLKTVDRYIAPEDFISQLALDTKISYNSGSDHIALNYIHEQDDIVISTMPMFELMRLLEWKDVPEFKTKEIWSVVCEIKEPLCDVYQTTYYPNKDLPFYRMSITGNKVICEFISEPKELTNYKDGVMKLEQVISHFLERDFGIYAETTRPEIKYQKYGKLVPSDERTCKKFIAWATNNYNVYSLGRWGLHRQILMDDVVQDINVIKTLIETENYGR